MALIKNYCSRTTREAHQSISIGRITATGAFIPFLLFVYLRLCVVVVVVVIAVVIGVRVNEIEIEVNVDYEYMFMIGCAESAVLTRIMSSGFAY